MTPKKKLSLSTFDGRLLDGLDFCQKVYELRDQLRAEVGGIESLRMRSTKQNKRLAEELVPLARYVEARYGEDRCIKVSWVSGSQPYDAILFSSGAIVEKCPALKEVVVEVATSVHENEYLGRELLNEHKPVFGVKQTFRVKKTGAISSTPYPEPHGQREIDLAEQIITRIKAKASKRYPPNAVLVVDCVPNGITFQEEWDNAVARVMQANVHDTFDEVFLTYSWPPHYSATLYGAAKNTAE
jgi:hypothetical protein